MPLQAVYVIDHAPAERAAVTAQLREMGFEAWPFRAGSQFTAMLPGLEPSCIVLDIGPDSGGLEVLEGLAEQKVEWPVIAVSSDVDLSAILAAMKLGAVDYLQKPLCAIKLQASLSLGRAALARMREASAIRGHAQRRTGQLSKRELEVGRALLRGLPNKIAAHKLGLSVRTVEMHRAHMLRKLGVRSLAEGAVLLTQAGVSASGPAQVSAAACDLSLEAA